MPISVITGGQYGSEGKGKIAHYVAGLRPGAVAVRVGGPNSGHTVIGPDGRTYVLRQLPTAAIISGTKSYLCPGTFIDTQVLLQEIEILGLTEEDVMIDPKATIIRRDHKLAEDKGGLSARIGSTLSGLGASYLERISRVSETIQVSAARELRAFLGNTSIRLAQHLAAGRRVIVEGTQGFGLSVLHSDHYPFTTARDTTAAAFLAEAGLSPIDVDEVYLVLRAFPIRVAGNSGPLPNEIDWRTVTRESGSSQPLEERTSVTDRIRRVARFDAEVVKKAIRTNKPTAIVMNHLDYIDASVRDQADISEAIRKFVSMIESQIETSIDYLGVGPSSIVHRHSAARFAGNWAKQA